MEYAPHLATALVVSLGVLMALWPNLPFMADEVAFWLAMPDLQGSFVSTEIMANEYSDEDMDFIAALVLSGDAHYDLESQTVRFT